jgi:hypothetical protein
LNAALIGETIAGARRFEDQQMTRTPFTRTLPIACVTPVRFCIALACGLALGVSILSGQAAAHERPSRLPLGDNRVATAPEQGKLFACQTPPARGGAHVVGPWIRDNHWHPAEKPTVAGEVGWPHQASWAVEGERRVLSANGLPPHATGVYPIEAGTPAHAFDRNPNRITPRRVMIAVPATPVMAPEPQCVGLGPIAFTLDGVAIFNALDLLKRDAPAYEIQDACNGHPEERGVYHYHDWSPCIRGADGKPARPGELVGFAIDGFPIVAPGRADGQRVTNADLDACHGKTGPVTIDGVAKTTYHYQFTWEFPYTIGCFRGEPVRRR